MFVNVYACKNIVRYRQVYCVNHMVLTQLFKPGTAIDVAVGWLGKNTTRSISRVIQVYVYIVL